MQVNSAVPWRMNHDDAQWHAVPEHNAHDQTLPEAIGCCRSRMFTLDTGLNYIETHYTPNRHLAIFSQMPQQVPRMVLTVALSGHSRFQNNHGTPIDFKSGYSTITTFNASEGSRLYQDRQAVTQLRFSMTQAWLERYFGVGAFAAGFALNAVQVVSQHPSAATTLLAARGLLQNPLPAGAQALFRQGQAMSIVATELGRLLAAAPAQSPSLSAHEKRLAEGARDILSAEFKNPPSVAELSKRVGTNPFKLKQLFHIHFNTTPYALLLDIRMAHAHRLLVTREYPVAMVAEAVGYPYAGNFSAAFAKYFGFPPKQLSRRI